MTQLELPAETWPCDVCNATGYEPDGRRCRICQGARWLDYDPAELAGNPFHGLDAA
jgi:hypothetical protein